MHNESARSSWIAVLVASACASGVVAKHDEAPAREPLRPGDEHTPSELVDREPPASSAAPALCPAVQTVSTPTRTRFTLDGDVLFDTAKADLKPDAMPMLSRLGSAIQQHHSAAIIIEGHTDDRGGDAYNMELSHQRATSVATWFVSHGIEEQRITKRGYGNKHPRVPNTSDGARARNRRVEIVLVESTAPSPALPDTQSCGNVPACCAWSQRAGGHCIGKAFHGWSSDLVASALEDRVGVLRLDGCAATRPSPAIWITSTDERMIAALDESTGKQRFRVPTYGFSPVRTAIAPDGSAWIANRDSGSYVHIAIDGKPLCTSAYNRCVTRAAAVDPRGHAWFGCNDTGEVIEVSDRETDGTIDAVPTPEEGGTPRGDAVPLPRCKELGSVMVEAPDAAFYPYGMAIGAAGALWVTENGGRYARVDWRSRKVLQVFNPLVDTLVQQNDGCWGAYGITVDRDGNPWIADFGCSTVVKVDGASGKIVGIYKGGPAGLSRPRGIGVDLSNHVWAASNGSTYVDEFTPDGRWIKRVDLQACGTGLGPLGTGVDSNGQIWTVLNGDGLVARFGTDGKLTGCYPEPTNAPAFKNPYTYSDFTGSSLEANSERGKARTRFEHDHDAVWRAATFSLAMPPGTGVCLRARSARVPEALATARWSEPVCPTSSDARRATIALDGTGGPVRVEPGRFLEIEVTLRSGAIGTSPIVGPISVAATEP